MSTYLKGYPFRGLHNRPTTQAIGKIVKKFEETGVVTNIERLGYHRFARSAENIAVVSESVAEDSNVSIPCHSQELFCIYIYTFIQQPTDDSQNR